jgi:hypothetical protein
MMTTKLLQCKNCENSFSKERCFTVKIINPETKTFKVLTALENGDRLTASEARKRFGVGNLSAEASRLRQAGFAVYANQRKAGNGVVVTEYRIGRPSRRVVAAGYKAMALGLA